MLQTRTDGKFFLVKIDPADPNYRTCYMIIRSLLSTYENVTGEWVVDYADFKVLKRKLDEAGLVEGRTASSEAFALLKHYSKMEAFNQRLKHGEYNGKVLELLDGKLKTVPYEDQLSGIAFLYKNPRSMLMDSMGIGKTLQALAVSAIVSSESSRTLVVAPLPVLLGFEKEVLEHTYLKPYVVPSGRKAAAKALKKNLKGDWNVLLVHPENIIGYKKELESELTGIICRIPFETVLIDEFHWYKNTDAKRSKVLSSMLRRIKTLEGKPPRVHPMTGTLVSENPLNAYFALQIMGNGNLPTQVKYEKYFNIIKEIQVPRMDPKTGKTYKISIPKVVGYKNLDILRERLESCSIRRTKADLKGFPDKTMQTRTVILSGRQKTLYKDLSDGVKSSLTDREDLDTFFSVNNAGIRLIQLLNHPRLIGEATKSAKYEALSEILEEVLSDPDQKIILWTEYRAAVDLIHELWNDQYGVMKLYGGVDIDEDLEKKFVYGNEIRIAAALPKKAGTGVDFLARARTSVFIDYIRSSTEKNQSIDRIHRRVKTEGELTWLDKMRAQPCTIIQLQAKGTVDEYIAERMREKDSMSETVTPSISKKSISKFL